MKYLSKAYIYLSVSGKELDIKDFAELAQINPTEVGENRFGEKFLEYKIEAKNANHGLDEAIDKLMQTLKLKSNEIKVYASLRGLYIKIFVVIQSKNNENNGVFLNHKFIEFLNDIDAEFEFDTYI